MEITQDGPFLIIERDGSVARFPADLNDDLEELQDQDIYVTVAGDPTYYLSLMTLDAIGTVLRRWAQTGEATASRYYCELDLVITPRPGITATIEAIDGLIRAGDIARACWSPRTLMPAWSTRSRRTCPARRGRDAAPTGAVSKQAVLLA
ncbi:hypothetical protein GCM10010112_80990 [Actinoplanes lobatus]|uniref:Uncharacterized protein n=1 Tax=Actinoplanes lobatus TaxID=113568 RepID=A0A7W7HNT6_9ACTN|nr:hypothetical protein [Actinoplanes lobatus]GGN93116.1 hypothetical protein GCM10010112_80990 [Actinoplanes lobatus]GIE43990.1 hypothetical protein Alo02nite_68880 [Actinoplanes lobatus]